MLDDVTNIVPKIARVDAGMMQVCRKGVAVSSEHGQCPDEISSKKRDIMPIDRKSNAGIMQEDRIMPKSRKFDTGIMKEHRRCDGGST